MAVKDLEAATGDGLDSPESSRRWRDWPAANRALIGIVGTLVVLSFAVRGIGLGTVNDIFIDELTYTELGRSIARGELPNLHGAPFLLHPPGALLLEAMYIRVLGLDGANAELALELRWLAAGLGSLTVGIAFLIMDRVCRRPVALGGALLLAVDPFVLRSQTRVMLEPAGVLLLLAGWLLVILFLADPDRSRRRGRLIAGGGLLGCALVVKDMNAVFIFVPLVLAIVWRTTLDWRPAGLVASSAVVPYAAYLVLLAVNGQYGLWFHFKWLGLTRMIGVRQETGFNSPGSPSVSGRIIDQLEKFGTSYAVLAACLIAGAAVAVVSKSPARRLLGLLAIAAGAFSWFVALVGAFEEQFGYYVLVISVLALAVAVDELWNRSFIRPVISVGATVLLVGSAVLGLSSRFVVDDGITALRAWVDQELPPGSRIGMTTPTVEFSLAPRVGAGVWPSLTSLSQNNAQYVVTAAKPIQEGYGYAAPELLTWLDDHAQKVYTRATPTLGDVAVWRLDRAVVANAVRDGDGIPPVRGSHP